MHHAWNCLLSNAALHTANLLAFALLFPCSQHSIAVDRSQASNSTWAVQAFPTALLALVGRLLLMHTDESTHWQMAGSGAWVHAAALIAQGAAAPDLLLRTTSHLASLA
jgi:hypothetical protein